MALLVVLSGLFFFSILLIIIKSFSKSKQNETMTAFLPKSRSEMIKGMAAIAIVFTHIASYSKGAAPSGLLRYYNLFCTTVGGIGVDLFFFVSGYGNYFSVMHNKEHRIKWLFKRCATLLIVYVICFLIVMGVLYAGGYRTTVEHILREVRNLSIPYSSVWYVKIQLLAYVFLVIASFLKERRHKVIAVTVLCLLSSVLLYSAGLDEKWWKSTACFAAGVFVGAYRDVIEQILVQHRKAILVGSILLFPFAYVSAVLVDAYAIKTIGNIVLCFVIIALVQLLQMDSSVYSKIGSYSLSMYLIHRSLVAWILNDGKTTELRVAMIVVLSIVLTVIAKLISDAIINRSVNKIS